MIWLYFMQAGDGPVKIGLARDPEARAELLQVGNAEPLVVLAAVPGDVELEKRLHRRFASGHLRGEWFSIDTPGLREAIGAAVHSEAGAVVAERGMCRHCGLRPVAPPRTRVCSEACERERKRARSAQWRAERSQDV